MRNVMIYIALLLCIKAGAMQVKDFTVTHLGKAEGMTNQRVRDFSPC